MLFCELVTAENISSEILPLISWGVIRPSNKSVIQSVDLVQTSLKVGLRTMFEAVFGCNIPSGQSLQQGSCKRP